MTKPHVPIPTTEPHITRRPAQKLNKRCWWINTQLHAAFLDYLYEEKGYQWFDLRRVVAEPWKWTPEFAEWEASRE